MVSKLTSRRLVLAGLSSLAGLSITPSGPVRADGMMPMRAIRGFSLGEMNITVIDDGSFSMGVGMFGSNAPKGQVGDLLASYGLSPKKAEMPFVSYTHLTLPTILLV